MTDDKRVIENFLDYCAQRGVRLCISDSEQDGKRVLVSRNGILEMYRLDGGLGR